MVVTTMDPLEALRKRIEEASPDVLRDLVRVFAQILMGAEVDAVCNAAYGERSPDRANRRNGYRARGLGHPGGHDRAFDPQAALGQLLSLLAHRAPQASRAGAHRGGR